MSAALLFSAAFLASGVEMVEALTIILATGITRGWRSALLGAAAGVVILAIIIAIFGSALDRYVPIDALRLVVGTFLLLFGLQWLRKAILRYAGIVGLHDETAIFARTVGNLKSDDAEHAGIDWTGWTVAFKGVLLEGLEVAFICVSFGSNAGDTGVAGLDGVALAAAAAILALLLVTIAGVAVHRPLAKVPENTMKFAVGLMLSAFGTFWAGEGVGIEWPFVDGAILVLLAVYGVASGIAVARLRRRALVSAAL